MNMYFMQFVILLITLQLLSTRCSEQSLDVNTLHSSDSELDAWQLYRLIDEYEQSIQENEKKLLELENEIETQLASVDFNDLVDFRTELADTHNQVTRIAELEFKVNEQESRLERQEYVLNKYREEHEHLPSQCSLYAGILENIQLIKVGSIEPILVHCKVENIGHGSPFMVIQRRLDGTVNFNRSWTEYKEGFGDANSEFFIGLNMIHQITTQQRHELLIILTDFNNENRFASYDSFVIGSEDESYALKELGSYFGNAGDALIYNKLMKFSTYDRDNDKHPRNCAINFQAWWHKSCTYSNLNGIYPRPSVRQGLGIFWISWAGQFHPLRTVQMMIRPKLI
ncbi:microfibril-associated glycoprotein 4-like [Drosophila montana]|uniref:microfibril-associated glycoprotein 4-like n=1 Tax=Drosophila montana TaxID=40370 RepID=UPI00313C8714